VRHYVDDLTAAGFDDIVVEDLSKMYRAHAEGVEDIAINSGRSLGEGSRPDQWSAMALEFIRRGNKIGVRITARSE